jgi:adenosylcobyric acid synthase
MGICGGFQMLGSRLEDPCGVENDGVPLERQGLGLLKVRTVFNKEKITRPVRASLYDSSFASDSWKARVFQGYEIHMGDTERSRGVRPLATLVARDNLEILDGAIDSTGHVLGTYLHGFFDDDSFRHGFLDWARASRNLASIREDEKAFATADREARLNRWADHLRGSLRLDLIRSPRSEMGLPERSFRAVPYFKR